MDYGPDCFFELSGSYSFGSRILYYCCIVASLVLAAYRKFWINRIGPKLAHLQQSRGHRVDIALAFAISTTMITSFVAVVHIFVMGVVGFSFQEYHQVVDLDVFATRHFAWMGFYTILTLRAIWPYKISPGQAKLIVSMTLLWQVFFWIGFTGSLQNAKPNYPEGLPKCKARQARLRHGSTPFEYSEDFFAAGSFAVWEATMCTGSLAFILDIGFRIQRRHFAQERFYVRYVKGVTWFAFGALWITSVVNAERNFLNPPFKKHSESIGAIGQWGALLNAFLASIGYIIFVSLGGGIKVDPKLRCESVRLGLLVTLYKATVVPAWAQTHQGDGNDGPDEHDHSHHGRQSLVPGTGDSDSLRQPGTFRDFPRGDHITVNTPPASALDYEDFDVERQAPFARVTHEQVEAQSDTESSPNINPGTVTTRSSISGFFHAFLAATRWISRRQEQHGQGHGHHRFDSSATDATAVETPEDLTPVKEEPGQHGIQLQDLASSTVPTLLKTQGQDP